MPVNVVKTKSDEKKWDKAKDKAEDAGQKENWPYVMSIYKNMKGGSVDRFQKIAYTVFEKEILGEK